MEENFMHWRSIMVNNELYQNELEAEAKRERLARLAKRPSMHGAVLLLVFALLLLGGL